MKKLHGIHLVALMVLLMACFGCGDKKTIERISKMDDATLRKAIKDYPQEGKALTLMKEELARRGPEEEPESKEDADVDEADADDTIEEEAVSATEEPDADDDKAESEE